MYHAVSQKQVRPALKKFILGFEWWRFRQKNVGDIDQWRIECPHFEPIHVEIVNLVVPGVNDSDSTIATVIQEHLKRLGSDTPLHFTRFAPAYKFHAPATSVHRLEYARETARKAGIRYAYVGNVHGHPYENTFCPECNERLIARDGYAITSYRLTRENRCPACGTRIPITGHYVKKDETRNRY